MRANAHGHEKWMSCFCLFTTVTNLIPSLTNGLSGALLCFGSGFGD